MSTPTEPGPGEGRTASGAPGVAAGPADSTGFTDVPSWVPMALALWATDAFVGVVAALVVAVVGGLCWLLVNAPRTATGPSRGDGGPPGPGWD